MVRVDYQPDSDGQLICHSQNYLPNQEEAMAMHDTLSRPSRKASYRLIMHYMQCEGHFRCRSLTNHSCFMLSDEWSQLGPGEPTRGGLRKDVKSMHC